MRRWPAASPDDNATSTPAAMMAGSSRPSTRVRSYEAVSKSRDLRAHPQAAGLLADAHHVHRSAGTRCVVLPAAGCRLADGVGHPTHGGDHSLVGHHVADDGHRAQNRHHPLEHRAEVRVKRAVSTLRPGRRRWAAATDLIPWRAAWGVPVQIRRPARRPCHRSPTTSSSSGGLTLRDTGGNGRLDESWKRWRSAVGRTSSATRRGAHAVMRAGRRARDDRREGGRL